MLRSLRYAALSWHLAWHLAALLRAMAVALVKARRHKLQLGGMIESLQVSPSSAVFLSCWLLSEMRLPLCPLSLSPKPSNVSAIDPELVVYSSKSSILPARRYEIGTCVDSQPDLQIIFFKEHTRDESMLTERVCALVGRRTGSATHHLASTKLSFVRARFISSQEIA